MKIIYVGHEGRGHSIVIGCARSSRVTDIICIPGNPGMQEVKLRNGSHPRCIYVDKKDIEVIKAKVMEVAEEEKPNLVIIGSEDFLATGLANELLKKKIAVFGPTKEAARFESSKIFAKKFMKKYGIPTAAYREFGIGRKEKAKAMRFAKTLNHHCVIKADGLAQGKGVSLCSSRNEVQKVLKQIPGDFLIEETLHGREVTIQVFFDGKRTMMMPPAKDYKCQKAGDKGPNTGGMGAVSADSLITQGEEQEIESIVQAWVKGCRSEHIFYRGVIYFGFMLTHSGPKVLEFNCRFGDPEAQVVLARLKSDLAELLYRTAKGTLHKMPVVVWDKKPALCVVLASKGYPGKYRVGERIRYFGRYRHKKHVTIIHAATAYESNGKKLLLITDGGRVACVLARGKNVLQCQKRAYAAVYRDLEDSFKSAFNRPDIGTDCA